MVRKGKGLILSLQRGSCEIHHIIVKSFSLIIEDPIPLEHGKGAWPCFEAGCTFLPSLRRFGARSVPITRFLTARYDLTCSTIARHKVMSQWSRIFDYFLEWFVSTGCCAHDIQKSLRWASSRLISAEGLIDMHIVVESLRKSFVLLYWHVHLFIMRTVVFDCHDRRM